MCRGCTFALGGFIFGNFLGLSLGLGILGSFLLYSMAMTKSRMVLFSEVYSLLMATLQKGQG